MPMGAIEARRCEFVEEKEDKLTGKKKLNECGKPMFRIGAEGEHGTAWVWVCAVHDKADDALALT